MREALRGWSASRIATQVCIAAAVGLCVACAQKEPTLEKAEIVRRADELVAKKQYGRAIALFDSAVQMDPRDGEVRLKLATTLRAAERWDRALNESLRASDLLPGNPAARRLAIWALLSRHRFIDAVDLSSTALKVEPNSADLHAMYAQAKAQLSSFAVALLKFEATWRLGKDIERARADLRKTVSIADDRAAENAFQRALALDPKLHEAQLGLVGFLWAAGRWEEGERQLRSLVDNDPSYSLLSRTLGLFYQWRGLNSEAEKYLTLSASTKDPESQITLGDFYLHRNRADEAVPIFTDLASRNNADSAVVLRAAEAELRVAKSDSAHQRALQVLSKEPENKDALRIKAQALLQLGQSGPALEAAKVAVAAAPTSSEARGVLGRSHRASGNTLGAFDELSEALRLDPKNLDLPRELADLAFALGRDRVALDFAREAVRDHPEDRNSLLTLIKALVRIKDFAAADLALKSLMTRGALAPSELVLQAAIQAGRGNADAARRIYLSVLKADAQSFDALSGLVSLDLRAGQTASAVKRANDGLATHPKDLQYLLLAARATKAAGDLPQAELSLRLAQQIDPGHVEVAVLLADVLTLRNQRDAAIRAIEVTLAQRPAATELELAMADLQLHTGRVAEARSRLESLVARSSEAYIAGAKLAVLYANLGENLDQALALASTAKQHLPSEPLTSDAVGWVYVRKGFATMAIPQLEEAVRAAPSDPMFRYHLAIAFRDAGRQTLARGELTRALGLDPNFPESSAARAALAALPR